MDGGVQAWLDAIGASQPQTKTMTLPVYVQAGQVVLSRQFVREFPVADIPKARLLINEYLDDLFEMGMAQGERKDGAK